MNEPRAPIDLLTNALYVGAGLLLAYALLVWLAARPVFALHHIDVRGELTHVDKAQIHLLSSRSLRGNFFTVDLDKVRSDFEKLPWVREARVTRHWPDRLQMELHEHEPLGTWNNRQLISTTGEVFNATVSRDLPDLSGANEASQEVAEAYGKFSATLAPLGFKVGELNLSSRRAWRIKATGVQKLEPPHAPTEAAPDSAMPRLENSHLDISALETTTLEIALGRKDAEARLARFAGQYGKVVEQLGAAPTYVDLRYADGFAVKRPAQTLAENLKEQRQL